MKRFISIILLFAMLLTACGKEDAVSETTAVMTSAEVTTAITEKIAESEIETKETTANQIIVDYGEDITVTGVIVPNENTFPSYCLKLNNSVSIMLLDGDFSDCFNCDTLYFYDESELNGNYDYSQLSNKECTVTASLENYRGEGELFFLEPTVMVDGEEAEIIDNSELPYEFYVELCVYVKTCCVNYTEWWSDATPLKAELTHTNLGEITSDNYTEKMDRAKQLVDELYKIAYWEIRYRGYGELLIGLYIDSDNEVYLCYDY